MSSSWLRRPSSMSPCSQNARHRKCDPVLGCRLLRLHPQPVLMANVIARVHRLGMMNPYLPKPLTRGDIPDKRRGKRGTMETRVRPRVQRPPLPQRPNPLPLSLLCSRPRDALGVRARFRRRRVMSTVTNTPFRLRRTSVGKGIGIG